MDYQQTQQYFDAITLTGYMATLPAPTPANAKSVAAQQVALFEGIAKDGRLGALMQGSQDHIGYAYSRFNGDQFTYLASANTTVQPAGTVQQTVLAGDYLVLTAEGGEDRPLFDQLFQIYTTDLQPQQPQWPAHPAFIVEALLNGQPHEAVVALRIPLF